MQYPKHLNRITVLVDLPGDSTPGAGGPDLGSISPNEGAGRKIITQGPDPGASYVVEENGRLTKNASNYIAGPGGDVHQEREFVELGGSFSGRLRSHPNTWYSALFAQGRLQSIERCDYGSFEGQACYYYANGRPLELSDTEYAGRRREEHPLEYVEHLWIEETYETGRGTLEVVTNTGDAFEVAQPTEGIPGGGELTLPSVGDSVTLYLGYGPLTGDYILGVDIASEPVYYEPLEKIFRRTVDEQPLIYRQVVAINRTDGPRPTAEETSERPVSVFDQAWPGLVEDRDTGPWTTSSGTIPSVPDTTADHDRVRELLRERSQDFYRRVDSWMHHQGTMRRTDREAGHGAFNEIEGGDEAPGS